MTISQQTDEFESLRPHLLSVAYRLTGTFADAEDAVQDAWMRWHSLGSERGEISDLKAAGMRNHMSQECIRTYVERHSQKRICRALIQLAMQRRA